MNQRLSNLSVAKFFIERTLNIMAWDSVLPNPIRE